MTALRWSFLAALLPLAAVAAPVQPEKPRQPEYFPLAEGTTWVYDVTGSDGERSSVRVEVTEIEKVGGHPCARLETSSGGSVTHTEHLAVLEDGVYRFTFDGVVLDPPVCVLKLPPKAGTRWNFAQKLAGGVVQGQLVAGEAYVKVPKFKGDAVTATGKDMKAGSATVTMTTYYAPKLGPVKQEARINKADVTLELREFTAGK
jgi:hypothetical protein